MELQLTPTERKRFWRQIDFQPRPSCWIWRGPLNSFGYGVVTVGGTHYAAHRLMYYLVKGEFPEAVLHTCDNPACVSPSHLRAGTINDNYQDALAKGRPITPFVEVEDLVPYPQETVDEIHKLRERGLKVADIAQRVGQDKWHVARVVYGLRDYKKAPGWEPTEVVPKDWEEIREADLGPFSREWTFSQACRRKYWFRSWCRHHGGGPTETPRICAPA